jgi:hypothetical protein
MTKKSILNLQGQERFSEFGRLLASFTSPVKVSVSCDTPSAVLRSSGRGERLFPRRGSLHLGHLACPNSLTEKVNKARLLTQGFF